MAFLKVTGVGANAESAEVRAGADVFVIHPNEELWIPDERVTAVTAAIGALGGSWAGAVVTRLPGEY